MSSRRSDSGLDGILLIDKPGGWTSHDVVAKVRGLTGQRRIGHTGTLDPMATGLLVLCLGRATRLVEYLVGHDKRYAGTVTLGRTTTTDDAEGETIAERPTPSLDSRMLETHVAHFRGELQQRPPAFSAVKVGGHRAYDLARKGEAPELAPRRVNIRRFDANLAGEATVNFDVVCSSGTYIRVIARELGESIGCGAHLSRLRRLKAGPFALSAAVTLEQLEAMLARGILEDILLPPDEGIAEMEAAILGEIGATSVAHGAPWQATGATVRAANPLRIYAASGSFVGVGSATSSGEIRASKVFLRVKSSI